jgi:hypothetical protein
MNYCYYSVYSIKLPFRNVSSSYYILVHVFGDLVIGKHPVKSYIQE